MNSIDKYVDNLVNPLEIPKIDKEDYKVQFTDHINSLKEEFIENGASEAEAVNLAIQNFGDSKDIKEFLQNNEINLNSKIRKGILVLAFIYLFLFFGHYIKISSIESNTGNFVILKSLIPFRTISAIINGINLYGVNLWCKDLIVTYIALFIPIGIFTPFIFNYYNSLKSNIKLFILFAVIIQIIKLIFIRKVPNFDFAMLNFVGCLIGYYFYKLILKIKPVSNLLFIYK